MRLFHGGAHIIEHINNRTIAAVMLSNNQRNLLYAGRACAVLLAVAVMPRMAAGGVSVLRHGREALVRCGFAESEDMVVNVRNLVNEWVYIVPKSLPTAEYAKGDLVHAGPDDFCAIHLGAVDNGFGFLSGNHGSYFVHRQTVKGHGFTVDDVGASVMHESGEAFVIVGVPDADHLLLHPEGKQGVRPMLPYLPDGRFTCRGKCWTPKETTRCQLYPMNRFRKFTWKDADGNEVPDGKEVVSSRIDLEMEHDVLDPRAVVAYVKSHPGRLCYPFVATKVNALVDSPESAGKAGDFMDIPPLISVKTVYRYDDRCCRLVERETTFVAPIHDATVLDVCYCWRQGEKEWTDVYFYIPRMKPITLRGRNGGADVTCDFTAVERMPSPPWRVNTVAKRCDSTDPTNPPDRFIRLLSRAGRRLGVALGYSLVDGVSAAGGNWPNRDTLYHFWDTGKMYPNVMSLHDVPAGKTYRHCAYTQFFDPSVEPDATAFYCHREKGDMIVYLDFHKTLKGKRVVLPPETDGCSLVVLEKTPSVTLRSGDVVKDGRIAVDVDGYGTLVLRVRRGM